MLIAQCQQSFGRTTQFHRIDLNHVSHVPKRGEDVEDLTQQSPGSLEGKQKFVHLSS